MIMFIQFEQIQKMVNEDLLGTGISTVFNSDSNKNREYYKMHYELMEYHLNFIEKLDSLFNFKGATVLEIGGSNMPYELLIEQMQVKKWVSLDTPWWGEKNFPHKEHPIPIIPIKDLNENHFSDNDEYKYIIIKGITDYINELFYDKFDIIVSNCCFEHIFNLPLAFENMYKTLRNNGVGYSSFSPIWSAYHGHHCWLTDDIGIKFSDLKCFPQHGHLLMSKLDIYKLLKLNFPNSKNIDKDSDQLKYGNNVNRHFYEDYEYFIKNSSFKKFIIQPSFETEVPSRIMTLLCEMYYPYTKFNYGGISMFFAK